MLDRFNKRPNEGVERISDVEDRAVEFTQTAAKRGKEKGNFKK